MRGTISYDPPVVSRLLPCFLLLAALIRSAGATPTAVLTLPPGERASDWSEAATLGGFRLSTDTSGTRVLVTVNAGGWRLHVVDASGVTHEATVVPPRSPEEREDLIWLARSLLTPVSAVGWGMTSPAPTPAMRVTVTPAAPRPAPPSVRTPPVVAAPKPRPASPAGTPPPAPVPIPAAAPTAPSPTAPAVTVPVVDSTAPPAVADATALPVSIAPPPLPDPPTDPNPEATVALVPTSETRVPLSGSANVSVGVAGMVGYRADIGIAVGLRVAASGHIGWLRLGAAVDWQPSTALDALNQERAVSEFGVTAELGWEGKGRVRPAVLPMGGMAVRRFTQGTLVVDRVPTPQLGLRTALGWEVRPGVIIEPWVSTTFDLRRIELDVAGDRETLGGQTGRAGLTLLARFGT